MKKQSLLAFLLLCAALCVCACGKKPKDNEIDYYKKVGNYDDPDDSLYQASDKDLELIGEVTPGEKKDPTATPTPTPIPEYVIVIDPGHGGSQVGSSFDGRKEKDLNLKRATLLKNYLETHYDHVTVYMTRTTDEGLSKDLTEDLRKRVEFAAEKKADIMVSLHLNASDNHKKSGATVCISKQPNIHDNSEKLAECILSRLATLGIKNNGPLLRDSNDTKDENGVPVDYYAICRHGAANNVIAVIVESCHMDNATDIEFIKTDAALNALAEQEAIGIMEFLTKYYVKQ
jgi:N-acetylmuramoyl-L-alanine amidase